MKRVVFVLKKKRKNIYSLDVIMLPIFRLSIFILYSLSYLLACVHCNQPTPFLTKRYVDYNFSEEGFLKHSVLQTIGRAEYQSSKRGNRSDRRICLQLAEEIARRRMLQIFLHLRFQKNAIRAHDKHFRTKESRTKVIKKDYPILFSESDLLQAELAFASILKRASVVLQDSRERNTCMLVYRLHGTNLGQEIRRQVMPFQPESLR